MTVILDYGMGNLRSVERAIASFGGQSRIQTDLSHASKLIIPGVGAFGAAMQQIAPLANDIRGAARDGMPILGICLGQQLLFESSEERGSYAGLGLLQGRVSYIQKSPDLKIPHVGWNALHYLRSDGLTAGGTEGEQVYFVHSLITECANEEDIIATSQHGPRIRGCRRTGQYLGLPISSRKEWSNRPSNARAVRVMLIIPAIDLRGGNAVRLAQGDFGRETIYDTDPLFVADGFIESGAQWLHVVDLDGARSGEPHHWGIIEAIVRRGVPVEFGGGVRSMETAQRLIDLGVSRIVVGTRLVTEPWFAARLFSEFGHRVAAGIDVRDGLAASSGWEDDSVLKAEELASQSAQQGCKRIILTDIRRDGMQSGPNTELLRAVQRACGLPIIQSGGIGSVSDLELLAAMGPDAPEAVIIGRALYEGTFGLEEALEAVATR